MVCAAISTDTIGIITAARNSDGWDRFFAPARWATSTMVAMISEWIVMLIRLTPPPTRNCLSMSTSHSGDPRRQQRERKGEAHVDDQDQHADEPRGAPGIGAQRGHHGCNEHHRHRAVPEFQIHRMRTD